MICAALERAELQLHHNGHNLFCGGNGSGRKTSLLEAIFLLGRGRSFRTRSSERLIRYGRERLVVFGRTGGLAPGGFGRGSAGVRTDDVGGANVSVTDARTERRLWDLPINPVQDSGSTQLGHFDSIQSGGLGLAGQNLLGQALGVQVSRTDGTTARISGANTRSLTELTQAFPVQVIDPGIHKLVEEGGHRRRRWMDWAVFHVERQFGDWWLRYARAPQAAQRRASHSSRPGWSLGFRADPIGRADRRSPWAIC